MSPRTRLHVAVLLTAPVLATGASSALAQVPSYGPAGAAAAGKEPASTTRAGAAKSSKTSVALKGLKSGELTAGTEIKAVGTLRPYVKGQRVTVLLHRGKQVIDRKTVNVRAKGGAGTFEFAKRLIKPGRYSVEAVHAKTSSLGGSKDESRRFHVNYPDLDPGSSGDAAKTFNKLLGDLGYVNDEGSKYDSATGRAVLAFHKVNGQARTENASAADFKMLAKGKGGYQLESPELGKHIEADLSRQVMVLAKGDEVEEIYHISTGAPATPTILGKFNFYRKDAGFNSLGMYYSAYFIRGYATHGYESVPDYPASHGCLRNPIPDSVHIYNWIDIGDPIHVYR